MYAGDPPEQLAAVVDYLSKDIGARRSPGRTGLWFECGADSLFWGN